MTRKEIEKEIKEEIKRNIKKKVKEFFVNCLLCVLLGGAFGLMFAYGLLHATTLQ